MNFSYFLAWSVSRFLFATYFRWRVVRPENVPPTGPVILAANHASILDPPLIGAGLSRPLNFLARDTLFRFPGVGALLRSWNAVPVDRDGGSGAGLKAILHRLHKGGAILLFAEGTRTRDGQLQPARAGVGLAVVKSNAPVVPVRVFGTYDAFGRRHPVPRPKRVAVAYGKPMMFEALREEAKTCSKPRLKGVYQEVANQIMAEIAKLELGVE